jgi:Heterokaryon incompatibility protein (HET)
MNGKGGIAIGTRDEVLSRNRCPFCRFVQGDSKFAPGLLDHLGTKSDDLFVVQVSAQDESLWLRVITANDVDGKPSGSLMLPGEQVVLVTHAEEGGSRTGRPVGPDPDYERMKYWLHLCDSDPFHRGVCTGPDVIRSEGRGSLPCLRVVDVWDMRLVDIGWQEKYVALSYVWGGANPPRLLGSQLPAYSTSNYLQNLLPEMPNTIQDVFTFTRKMGLRYLWFDSLCLVQDDPEDLYRGIMNMDLVYESSYVTVIAADTKSADSGIPGISLLRREAKQDRQSLKPGLEIMRVHSVDRHLKQSVWNTRGWT